MRRVLIVGGAGYVGSHCARHLASRGIDPIVYDDLSQGRRDFVRWGPFLQGDVRDTFALRTALRTHRPDAVFHLAALTLIGEDSGREDEYRDINVSGTASLLEAMRAEGCRRVVFSSSCAVYGKPQAERLDETHALDPINIYGTTKLEAEKLLADAAGEWGLEWVALRYFNAAGAAPDDGLGEAHDPETHLIPRALRSLLGLEPPLRIFGSDYATPDGTAIRDFVHVEDLARGHRAALEYLAQAGDSRAINLGSCRGYSVLEVLRKIERATGLKVPAHSAPRRPGDPGRLVADSRLAARLLNWSAAHDLERIVKDAWRWHAGQARP